VIPTTTHEDGNQKEWQMTEQRGDKQTGVCGAGTGPGGDLWTMKRKVPR